MDANKIAKCKLKFKETLNLKDHQVEKVVDRLVSMKKQADMDGVDFARFFSDEMMERRKLLEKRKRHNKINLKKQVANNTDFKLNFKDFEGKEEAVFEYLMSRISESHRQANGGVGSLPMEAKASTNKNKIMQPLNKAAVESPQVFNQLLKGDTDLELKYLKYSKGMDVDLTPAERLAFDGWKESGLRELEAKNDVGLDVKKLDTWSMKQKHNTSIMREMGFEKWFDEYINGKVSREDWNILDLDTNKMRPMTDPEFRRAALEDFDKIISRREIAEGEPSYRDSMAVKREKRRQFNFVDPKDELNYRKTMNEGAPLLEGYLRDAERTANEMAGIFHFGTKPVEGMEKFIANVKAKLLKEGKHALVTAFEKGGPAGVSGEKRLMRAFNEAIGKRNGPADNMVGNIFKGVKLITENKMLPFSYVATFTDTGTTAIYVNTVTGKSTMAAGFKAFTDTVSNLSLKKRRMFAAQIGIFVNEQMNGTKMRMVDEVVTRGSVGRAKGAQKKISRGIDTLRRWNVKATGLQQQAAAAKQSGARMLSAHLAEKMDEGKTFSGLKTGSKNERALYKELQKMGFDDQTWNFIAKHGVENFADLDGRMASVDLIFELDKKTVADFLGEKNVNSDAVIEFKANAEAKLTAVLERAGKIGSPEGDARLRSLFPDPSDGIGAQLVHAMLQFKTFPLAVMNSMRTIHGLGEGKFDKIWQVGRVAAVNSALGGIVILARDVINNRDPRHRLKDAQSIGGFMMDSFAQSGVGGLWGDLALAPTKDINIVRSIMGPGLGGLGYDASEALIKAAKQAKKGEPHKVAYHMTKFLAEYAPIIGTNLPLPGLMQLNAAFRRSMMEGFMELNFPNEVLNGEVRRYSRVMRGEQADKLIGGYK